MSSGVHDHWNRKRLYQVQGEDFLFWVLWLFASSLAFVSHFQYNSVFSKYYEIILSVNPFVFYCIYTISSYIQAHILESWLKLLLLF